MKALILAAGYATRLYPLTKAYPKALLTVKHKPIIDYIVEKMENIDEINEVIVVTNSKFIGRFRHWRKNKKGKKPITLVDDLTKDNATRRGAIGDMSFAVKKEKIKEDLLVIGGDNLFDCDLEDFLLFAARHIDSPLIGAYDIKTKKSASKFGVIKTSKEGRVVNFQEKPLKPKSTLVAMCLYYFPKKRLSLIEEYLAGKHGKHDAMGFYIDWLSKKCDVFAFVFNGNWFDIGSHKFYNEAKESFTQGSCVRAGSSK